MNCYEEINKYIRSLFYEENLDFSETNNDITIVGKSKLEDSESFIKFLKEVFSSEIKKCFKVIINNDGLPVNIKEYCDIEIYIDDIKREYKVESITVKVNKRELKENYINKYNFLKKINLQIYYSQKRLEEKIKASKCYLEDLLCEDKYSIFLILNEKCSVIYNGFAIISEDTITIETLQLSSQKYTERLEVRKEQIKQRNELSNWIGGTKWITPNELFSDIEYINNNIVEVIVELCTDLIIKSLANITIDTNGKLKSIFIATKRAEIEYNATEYSINSMKNLFKLYTWVYSNSTADKINFVRNIIVSIVVAKCQGHIYNLILKNSDWLVVSSKDSYDEFIEDSIEKYFESRFTLIDRIKNNVNSVNQKIDELMMKNSNNALAFVATIATGLLTYSSEDNSSLKIMKVIMLAYCLVLLVNVFYIIPSIKRQFKQIEEEYGYNINKYNEKFKLSEPLDIEEKHFAENKKSIEKTFFIMNTIYMIISIVILFLVFKNGLLDYIIKLI